MERKDFLSLLGLGAAAIVCDICLAGCKSQDDDSLPPHDVDFTLDLKDPTNRDLAKAGGSLYFDRIIIARPRGDEFVAVSQTCTHQKVIVQYDAVDKQFHCPNHGSNFTLDGKVINGPATQALKKYNTVLSGTSLRILS